MRANEHGLSSVWLAGPGKLGRLLKLLERIAKMNLKTLLAAGAACLSLLSSVAHAAPASQDSLNGWGALKFGMTPRQTCVTINQAGLTCTTTSYQDNRGKSREQLVFGDNRIRIGTATWQVKLFFTKPFDLDGGSLEEIVLEMSRDDSPGNSDAHHSCGSYLGDLEHQYGTFGQIPSPSGAPNYNLYAKDFANGARITFGFSDNSRCDFDNAKIYYLRNVEKPSPTPSTPSGHF
jgi:hypothetical protein